MEQVSKTATDGLSGLNFSGVKIIRTPPRSPNLNAFAERFVRSVKGECLERMIFFSEKQLQISVTRSLPVHVPVPDTSLPARRAGNGNVYG